MRGNRINELVHINAVGSIPACAGEPIFLGYVLLPRGVYPRVCGGTTSPSSQTMACWGLSPRVRGNRVATLGSIIEKRSIPACAGEPWTHPPGLPS